MSNFSLLNWKTVGPWIAEMIGTYTICQPQAKEPVDLQEAHDHIFGTVSIDACTKCHSSFHEKVEMAVQYLR